MPFLFSVTCRRPSLPLPLPFHRLHSFTRLCSVSVLLGVDLSFWKIRRLLDRAPLLLDAPGCPSACHLPEMPRHPRRPVQWPAQPCALPAGALGLRAEYADGSGQLRGVPSGTSAANMQSDYATLRGCTSLLATDLGSPSAVGN